MDRQIVYPGSIPLDTDILNIERNIMVALGYLTRATLGYTTVADGLNPYQTATPSMTINVSGGSMISLTTVDATAFGSLAADTVDPLMKMGITKSVTQFTLTAPTTSGQSINYLLEAAFQEADGTAVVLPYYNSSNPALAYSGPGNTGTAQNTQRLQSVSLQVKAGAPATTGTQVTPAPDSGYTGLYVITVPYGTTAITNSMMSVLAGAPLVDPMFVGRGVQPGRLLNVQVFSTAGTSTYTPTPGTKEIVVEVQGGSGGSAGLAATTSTQWACSPGANAGAYAKGRMAASSQTVTVGVAGAAGALGGSAGGNGGTSSFGSIITCGGGSATNATGPSNISVYAAQGYTAAAQAYGGSITNQPGALGQWSIGVSGTYVQAIGGGGGVMPLGFAGDGAAINGVNSGVAGNAGSPGAVVVWEYA